MRSVPSVSCVLLSFFVLSNFCPRPRFPPPNHHLPSPNPRILSFGEDQQRVKPAAYPFGAFYIYNHFGISNPPSSPQTLHSHPSTPRFSLPQTPTAPMRVHIGLTALQFLLVSAAPYNRRHIFDPTLSNYPAEFSPQGIIYENADGEIYVSQDCLPTSQPSSNVGDTSTSLFSTPSRSVEETSAMRSSTLSSYSDGTNTRTLSKYSCHLVHVEVYLPWLDSCPNGIALVNNLY